MKYILYKLEDEGRKITLLKFVDRSGWEVVARDAFAIHVLMNIIEGPGNLSFGRVITEQGIERYWAVQC